MSQDAFCFPVVSRSAQGSTKVGDSKVRSVSLSLGRQQNSMHSIFIGNGIKIANDILVTVREIVMVNFCC